MLYWPEYGKLKLLGLCGTSYHDAMDKATLPAINDTSVG